MEFDPVAYINDPDWHTSVYGLDRIRELLKRLGNPQERLKFVHVGGTNGKGSVCAYLDSVLRHAGYTCGLFTSPYIETFEERIRVNGENISAEDLYDVTLAVREQAEAMAEHPTEFELMCAVAMLHFARSGCDIVVAEVGLGGRWDATNVIDAPECCVIVRIGLDHTELLGDTTGKIAAEKAGIIKPGTHVVSWPQDDDALASIRAACKEADVPLVVADLDSLEQDQVDLDTAGPRPTRHFAYKGCGFDTQLLASYQPSNACLAIEALQVLRERGWNISDESLYEGIASAVWPGRFELFSSNPTVIIDGGHNPQGASVLAETLRDVLPNRKPIFVVGILGDKDYGAMLEQVGDLGDYFVCITPPNPRALPASELAHSLLALQPDANAYVAADFDDAIAHAFELAGEDGVICCFGSLYSIHDLKAALRRAGAGA